MRSVCQHWICQCRRPGSARTCRGTCPCCDARRCAAHRRKHLYVQRGGLEGGEAPPPHRQHELHQEAVLIAQRLPQLVLRFQETPQFWSISALAVTFNHPIAYNLTADCCGSMQRTRPWNTSDTSAAAGQVASGSLAAVCAAVGCSPWWPRSAGTPCRLQRAAPRPAGSPAS